MSSPSFFAELKRRNVYKVGAMYAVGGWLLVQVVTQVLPVFHVSDLVQRIIVLAIAAGFPVVLVLSWIYELTPQGIVRTDEVAADASITRQTGQRLNRAIIAGLSLAVLVLLARLLWPYAHSKDTDTAAASDDKSIAVLPFANLSDDKTNAYFAEGMQDEILTRLAKIGTLRVISRTSTLRYASSPDNIGEIAQQLGVANILEGSVQKAGNRVRVNVQLIRAAGDSHLWAETYDRTLDDIFGVQGEVAGAIAGALGAQLSGGERQELSAVPTHNAAAYDAYLRGVALFGRGFSIQAFVDSTQAFQQAVDADPGFAEAWARLARSGTLLVFFGVDASAGERARVLRAVETAERLGPDLQATQLARADYVYRVERDYEAARGLYEALGRRWPNNSEVLSALSYIAARQGRMEEGSELSRQALALDPRNLQMLKLRVVFFTALRRLSEAFVAVDRVQEQAPGERESLVMKAGLYEMQGELAQAQALLDAGKMPDSDFEPYIAQARLTHSYASLLPRLQEIADRGGSGYQAEAAAEARLCLADFQRLSGQPEAAAANYAKLRDAVTGMLQQQPDNANALAALAQAQAGLDQQAAALATMDQLLGLYPESKDAVFGRAYLDGRARLLARFGRKNEAFAGLQHLLAVPYTGGWFQGPLTPALLKLDPDFDTLRDDPRFQALLAANGGHAAP